MSTSEQEVMDLNYVQAVNTALRQALESDESVIVFGEDVGDGGGIFGATRQLRKRFGDRVFDTPISESVILGGALGAALENLRPVAELMWIDFSLVAMDQIVNQIANARYVSQGNVTAALTIRTQQGALPGSCAQHSQNLEAIFAHIPGLRVGLPSNPQDAYEMLLSGIFSDDPVMIIENRGLYFGDQAPVQISATALPVGGSRVLVEGADCTVVTWSAMAPVAQRAAQRCAQEGLSVEVIDLRWLNPLDLSTVMDSAAKTGRVLVVHEANLTGGFGAEVVARIATDPAGRDLRVRRLAAPDVRVPAAPHLQAAVLPGEDDIVDAIRQMEIEQ